MNILLTGGAGFIGTHTAKALHQAGHKIRILDCLDPQIHGTNAEFGKDLLSIADCVRGNICNAKDCEGALDGIEVIFHFASRTGVGQSMYDIGSYVGTNVLGTAVLLESIVKSHITLKRFVLSSSRAIYGEGLFHCKIHGTTHPPLRDSLPCKSVIFLCIAQPVVWKWLQFQPIPIARQNQCPSMQSQKNSKKTIVTILPAPLVYL